MESTERRFTVKVRSSGQVNSDFNDMAANLVLHIRKNSRPLSQIIPLSHYRMRNCGEYNWGRSRLNLPSPLPPSPFVQGNLTTKMIYKYLGESQENVSYCDQ